MAYWRNKAKELSDRYPGVRPSWVSEELAYYKRLAEAHTLVYYKLRGKGARSATFKGRAEEDYILHCLGCELADLEDMAITYQEDEDATETTSV